MDELINKLQKLAKEIDSLESSTNKEAYKRQKPKRRIRMRQPERRYYKNYRRENRGDLRRYNEKYQRKNKRQLKKTRKRNQRRDSQ